MKILLTILLITTCSFAFAQKGVGLLFEYNKSGSPKVFPLTGLYMNFKGQYLSTSVTIPAYSSVLLIKLDSPPLAGQIKSFDLQTGTNATTIRIVYYDDITGIEKVITHKHRFR